MRAVVSYESMYGNTRRVAEAVAQGLRAGLDVRVMPISELPDDALVGADLLVLGAPTHVHGLPRASTREDAARKASAPGDPRSLEETATRPGMREWLEAHPMLQKPVATFDTRVAMSPVITGRASKGIAKRLRHAGAETVVPAESFLVRGDDTLVPGELERAEAWGRALATSVTGVQIGAV
jgi:menaquinone-dependent protoporphyrinogen IX oxidase